MIEYKDNPDLREWARRQLEGIPRGVSSEARDAVVHLIDQQTMSPGYGTMVTLCGKAVKRRVGDRSTPNCRDCMRATGLPADLIRLHAS